MSQTSRNVTQQKLLLGKNPNSYRLFEDGRLIVNILFTFYMKKGINNIHTSQNFAYMVIRSKNTVFSDVTNVTERNMAFILELGKIFKILLVCLNRLCYSVLGSTRKIIKTYKYYKLWPIETEIFLVFGHKRHERVAHVIVRDKLIYSSHRICNNKL